MTDPDPQNRPAHKPGHKPTGNIDRVRRTASGLTVIGWTPAARVTLASGDRAVSVTPDIPRPDVAASLGLDPGTARLGYGVTLTAARRGPAVLLFEPAAGDPGEATAMIVPGTGQDPHDNLLFRLLPRRVAGLFNRFAAQHLDCSCPGPALHEADGAPLGNIDRVRLTGTRLSVEGWANARRLILQSGDQRRVADPELPRTDVAEATGLPAELGFFVDAAPPPPGTREAPVLTIEPRAGAPLVMALPLPAAGAARRRLFGRFLGALLAAAPALVLWRLTRNPRHRATIKRHLGLTGLIPAEALNPALLPTPGETDTPERTPEPTPEPTAVTIILPVYNAFDILPEVLDRVMTNTDLPFRLLLIEDCSSDDRVRPFLEDWAAARKGCPEKKVRLFLNDANLGFIGSVNKGLAEAKALGHPTILLNSDAFVPAGWASRLIRPMLLDETVATVTPMSNDAEIFSVPAICTRTVLEPGMADAIDTVAQSFNLAAAEAEAPTGVGFCMALNTAFLDDIPRLDTAFGRGYGEEVDWCQKAGRLGGRHLGIANLFVEHRGGESFGSEEKLKLVATNNARIARRYPTYDAEVQNFIAADPLVTGRLALTVAWAAAWAAQGEGRRVPVYLAHSLGGGAETYLQKRIADDLEQHGRPALVLRVGGARRWRLEAISESGLTAGETNDFDFLRRLLAPLDAREVVYSCGVGDPDPVTLPERLLDLAGGAPVEVLFHDFFPLSPSYTLLDGDDVYRGLGDPARHAGDAAHQIRAADGRTLELADWQAEWSRLLHTASALTVFSEDSRRQILSALPGLADAIRVEPHRLPFTPPDLPRPQGGRRVVAALGNLNVPKGAAVLQGLAAKLVPNRESGDLPDLVLVGNIDPAFALPGHVKVHGTYSVADLPAIASRYGITDWLIPSIWPETFSYTTHEALATGLPVWAFALGAQGDAVAARANGRPVPLDPGDVPEESLLAALTAPTPPAMTAAAAKTTIPETLS